MTVEVELVGVDLSIGSYRILSDLNIKALAGSFVTLLGPSGSGKSTTLNVIAGFAKPDRGQVMFGGTDMVNLPPGARDLGIVFQNYAIFPHMTVEQNIHFPLQAKGITENKAKRTAEVLELVKLGGFEKRSASQLSGGQLQRVALARALAPRPNVLLLDEPLSALDKQLREAMQSELKTIQREVGITTISVTHDQAEALSMSDHVIVLDQGKIAQQGSAEEMYSKPTSEFLARFLGEVNLIPKNEAYTILPSEMIDPLPSDHLVVLRPEDIELTAANTPGQGSITIQNVQFHGGSFRVEARVSGMASPMVARADYRGIETLPKVGQEFRMNLRKSRLHSVPIGQQLKR